MFERENLYFNKHRNELALTHKNEFAVIQNESIMGFYSTVDEAFEKSKVTMRPGTFVIKQILEENSEPYYLTRVFDYK